MGKRGMYRAMIVFALIALAGLLSVQVYWFTKVYELEESELNSTINVALRDVADKLLKSQGDSSAQITVTQVASNAFEVKKMHSIDYPSLDTTVRSVFVKHGLLLPFQLSVIEQQKKTLAFGNFYTNGALSGAQAICTERVLPRHATFNLEVTFPEKATDVVYRMSLWIASAITSFVVLGIFSYLIFDLIKQKNLVTLKTDFVNNMTHELQTPIATIALASEVLAKSSVRLSRERMTHYAEIISSENQRLKVHVEQVLQTAMLDKGQLILNKQEVNVNTIIGEVIKSFTLRIQRRGGQLRTDLQATNPVMIGDPFHLKNIFYSLLDNADKYSPDAPDITVCTTDKEKGVCISISDKGIGISEKAQPFIFEKFYRAPSGDVHDVKGFGLGLTYVKSIVNAHQGRVRLAGEGSKGSCFELYFQNY